MVHYASADQIARAIVAASKLVGADPLKIFESQAAHVAGQPVARARFLAFVALRAALPDCHCIAQARGVGLTGAAPTSNVPKAKKASWWREDWVDEVVGAILAPEVEADDVAAPSSGPSGHLLPQGEKAAPAPSPEEKLRRHYRPAPKPKRSAARALDLGEPVSGRSALDQRRAGVTPHYGDDDDDIQRGRAGCIRKPVSLPRLKFLEKDF